MHSPGTSTQESAQRNTGASPVHCSVETSFGSAVVADRVPPEDQEVWVAGLAAYAIDHRYYEVVYESLKDQFAHYYLLLKDAGGTTRAIQPFLIVSQDLATGTPAAIRKLLSGIRRHFP